MFKNFDEFITYVALIIIILFIIRLFLSFIFNVNKESFSLKDQMKFFYRNEDE